MSGLRQRKAEKGPLDAEPTYEPEKVKKLPNYQLPHEPISKKAYVLLVILTIASFFTRFYKIDYPNQVVFDEVHFGKFASYYLRRTYYFDVHPPLGKLMIAGTGYAAGYNGSYLFDKIGQDYLERDVPYVALRSLPALFGAMLVPLVFLILVESDHSLQASFMGASMCLFDTALTAQCRLILLDSFLIFFDIFSVLAWVKFYKLRFQPYTLQWWLWLCLSGAGIALTTGVKMVGLFIVALIGLSTLQDLWRLMDIRRGLGMKEILKQFYARVFGLIVLPLLLYMAFFWIHFNVLNRTGPGDNFMSPPFQATLEGNKLNQESRVVVYGAKLSILHYDTSNYLHSHAHNYPLRYDDGRISSQGQQVTGYPHNDTNNMWVFIPVEGALEEVDENGELQPRSVRHGDIVRIEHTNTKRFLLTHDVASPLTPTHQEVTCVDPEDHKRYNETLWRIDVVDHDEDSDDDLIGTIDTKIRIIHIDTGVALHTHKGHYGEWGFGQQEVNGNKNAKEKQNHWVIDSIKSDKLTAIKRVASNEKRPSFLRKFFELQNVMIKQNAGLTATHPYQSTPITWPLLARGISFWVNHKDAQIYLIGNPLIWWFGMFCVVLLLSVLIIDALARRRGINELDFVSRRRIQITGGFFLGGWALHYLPFFIMGRSLFLHHYLPALVFTFLITANVFDFATRRDSGMAKNVIALLLISFFGIGFWYFSPFVYGTQLTPEEIDARKWLETWDFLYGSKK